MMSDSFTSEFCYRFEEDAGETVRDKLYTYFGLGSSLKRSVPCDDPSLVQKTRQV